MDGQPHHDTNRSRRDSTISLDDPAWRSQGNDGSNSMHDDLERLPNHSGTPRPPASVFIPLDLPRADYSLENGSGPTRQTTQTPSLRLFLLERYLLEENNHERRALGLETLPILNRAVVRDKLSHVEPTVLGESLKTVRPSHSSQSNACVDKNSQESEEQPSSRPHSRIGRERSTSVMEKRSKSCPETPSNYWTSLTSPLPFRAATHGDSTECIEVDPRYLSPRGEPLSASLGDEDDLEEEIVRQAMQMMQDRKKQTTAGRQLVRLRRRRQSKNEIPKTTPNKIAGPK
ncbi:hypothetical protein PT974_11188 [Cladobotryum mycophilum]|uniref:Uncharacterized protein n=1 Tax=Cladobotryum mycophilum TaxID=491253 RepID=A0ABR0S4H2_9HYPO